MGNLCAHIAVCVHCPLDIKQDLVVVGTTGPLSRDVSNNKDRFLCSVSAEAVAEYYHLHCPCPSSTESSDVFLSQLYF